MSAEGATAIVADAGAGWTARAPLHVDARLTRVEKRVRVEARAAARVRAACGRCLADVDLDLPVAFELTLVPREEVAPARKGARDDARGPRGGSFSAQQAEEDVYEGREIDLDPLVREQLLLALPEYPLCSDECRGLCTACGANLNERECGCDRRVADPRWAKLKDFKAQ